MKVIFLSQNDPFYTIYFYKEFLKVYKNEFELESVYLLSPMNDSLKKLVNRTWNFYGPIGFFKYGVKYVFVKLLEKLGFSVSPYNLLKKHKIKVEKIKNVNDPLFLDQLKKQNPDILVSVSCPQIFKKELLSIPQIVTLNIHSGLIPKYRGLFPNFWQMLNGEKQAIVTFHEVEAKVDKGNIVKEIPVEIIKNMTLTNLIQKTKEVSASGLIELINQYKSGKVVSYEHNNIAENYYTFPGKKSRLAFKNKGLKI